MEPLLLLPPLPRMRRRCPRCAVEVDTSTRMCPRCRRPLDAERLATDERRRYWLGAGCALGLLLLLVWMFAWLGVG